MRLRFILDKCYVLNKGERGGLPDEDVWFLRVLQRGGRAPRHRHHPHQLYPRAAAVPQESGACK